MLFVRLDVTWITSAAVAGVTVGGIVLWEVGSKAREGRCGGVKCKASKYRQAMTKPHRLLRAQRITARDHLLRTSRSRNMVEPQRKYKPTMTSQMLAVVVGSQPLRGSGSVHLDARIFLI
jgi:hypothetical protein